MDKKKNTIIKEIYATSFDKETFKWKVVKLPVAKECSKYVSIKDGRRIDTESIQGIYTEGIRLYGLEYSLMNGNTIYSLKPFNASERNEINKRIFEDAKFDLERLKNELVRTEECVETLRTRIGEQEKLVESIATIMGD